MSRPPSGPLFGPGPRLTLLILAVGAAAGCHRWHAAHPSGPAVAPEPARPARPEGPAPQFREVSAEAGIRYRWTVAGKRPLTILQTIGNGAAWLDYDGDGNLDLLLVGSPLALYRGDGKGRFTDVTQATGLGGLRGHFLGCAAGDMDGDAFPDLYLSAYRGGALLRNDAGKRFTAVAAGGGIPAQKWGTSCALADVDGDGDLDLYVCNYIQFDAKTRPQFCDFSGVLSSCGPRFYEPERGRLYLNETARGGPLRFRDRTAEWGAATVAGKALGAAFADFDGSGRESLALANDEMPGDLLLNTGRRFRNVATSAGVAFDRNGSVHAGMGTDWGDFDNDGRLDLAVATFVHETKSIYRNEGQGLFTDVSGQLGVTEATLPYIAFGMKWLDADNDGWLDLMLANGHVQDNVERIDPKISYREPTQLFRNRQGVAFEDVSARAGEAFGRPLVGRGLATGDYDNDGRVDALVVDSEGTPLLLHNETPNPGHWLLLRLQGTRGNRDAMGALVTVATSAGRVTRRCGTDGSYLSASDPRVHVGLGGATSAAVTVRWPGGKSQSFGELPADRITTLREGAGLAAAGARP